MDAGKRVASRTEQIGGHLLEIDGPVLVCRYVGEISLAEIGAVHQTLEAVLREQGHAYQLIDMTRLQMPSAEVRRWISKWAQRHTLEAVISFGASHAIFVVTNLLGRAIHLLRADKRPAVLFERDESAALSALANLREQRRLRLRTSRQN